jgi:hypothetical protein
VTGFGGGDHPPNSNVYPRRPVPGHALHLPPSTHRFPRAQLVPHDELVDDSSIDVELFQEHVQSIIDTSIDNYTDIRLRWGRSFDLMTEGAASHNTHA